MFLVARWYNARQTKNSNSTVAGVRHNTLSSDQASFSGRAPRPTREPESRPDPVFRHPSQAPPPRRPKIVFSEPPPDEVHFRPLGSSPDDLSGLCDAYTGARLDPSRGIVRCSKCQVCYHLDSFQLLREQNNGQCANCMSTDIHAIPGESAKSLHGWRDFRPDIVTLQDYRNHVGRIVTFEGHVLDIKPSKSGTGFAAMFEPGSWTEGLKLIFPSRYVERVGGRDFIFNMLNRTVRVRGLLVSHQIFGHQIIVTEPSMILRVM